jgi:hypothetical protein
MAGKQRFLMADDTTPLGPPVLILMDCIAPLNWAVCACALAQRTNADTRRKVVIFPRDDAARLHTPASNDAAQRGAVASPAAAWVGTATNCDMG